MAIARAWRLLSFGAARSTIKVNVNDNAYSVLRDYPDMHPFSAKFYRIARIADVDELRR